MINVGIYKNSELFKAKWLVLPAPPACFGLFNKEINKRYRSGKISELLGKDSNVFSLRSSSRLVGLLSLTRLSWDSKYFGIGMAEIRALSCSGIDVVATEQKSILLTLATDFCRQKNIKHISVKIDPGDFSGISSLENNGFRLMGSRLTYVLNFKRVDLPEFTDLCRIREFKKSDVLSLVELARRYAPRDSRFSLDKYLSSERSKNFYVEWIKNACRGKFADGVLVAERNKKVVGFATYRFNAELKKLAGIRCIHRGLLVVSPEGRGASFSLFRELRHHAMSRFGAESGEWVLNNFNYPMVRILQQIGASFVNMEHVFHKWVD